MAEESNTKIIADLQRFLTQQERGEGVEPSQDLNTDLPTGVNIRFIQFCRGMQVGFGLKAYGTIADQTGAIMVSRERKGREEAEDVAVGLMDRKDRERRMYGPQYQDLDDKDKKGRR